MQHQMRFFQKLDLSVPESVGPKLLASTNQMKHFLKLQTLNTVFNSVVLISKIWTQTFFASEFVYNFFSLYFFCLAFPQIFLHLIPASPHPPQRPDAFKVYYKHSSVEFAHTICFINLAS